MRKCRECRSDVTGGNDDREVRIRSDRRYRSEDDEKGCEGLVHEIANWHVVGGAGEAMRMQRGKEDGGRQKEGRRWPSLLGERGFGWIQVIVT